MPVTPTYPGVYVQGLKSPVHTITGVATSIGLFIGMASDGPMSTPTQCLTFTDFVRTFSADTSQGQMANYVRLFFLNGGSNCYIMRIANGASFASVTLKNEDSTPKPVLVLTAKDAGAAGENIRAIVTYGGLQPEATFNLNLFQWSKDASGNLVPINNENWPNLSMDPASPLYAPTYLTQNSQLVNVALAVGAPAIAAGYSASGRTVDVTGGVAAAFGPLLDTVAGVNKQFLINVNGKGAVNVVLTNFASANVLGTLAADLTTVINAALNGANQTETVAVTFTATQRLVITASKGDVFVTPGAQNDLAVPMMLGTAQGGLEVSGAALLRPAPNGISFQPTAQNLDDFASHTQADIVGVSIDVMNPDGTFTSDTVKMDASVPAPQQIVTTAAADPMSKDGYPSSPNGHSDGLREKLAIIMQDINEFSPTTAGNLNIWNATLTNYRLIVAPSTLTPDNFVSANFSAIKTLPATKLALSGFRSPNVHYYTVGVGGASQGDQISATVRASDGTAPKIKDYNDAYPIIDSQVDLFNLMVLPPNTPTDDMTPFYADASVFCDGRRALLLMDPPPVWTGSQTPAAKVAGLRTGLVSNHSALFYPQITVADATTSLNVNIGAAGAIAGLCARIDGTRGVWKAPAGTEADIRGINGVAQRFSNGEHGVMNPRAINVIRQFPEGIVNFGARTMAGDDNFGDENKYLPVMRMTNFLEETLLRALRWAVFEPNDEPLWSAIRLNVGVFMHDLFRQGAFQGATPSDAYLVRCDSETTPQSDIDAGKVNVIVGFAPLKPAEFVIIYLQQLAGQLQV